MDYNEIINNIKPQSKEEKKVYELSNKLIKHMDNYVKTKNTDINVILVGSIAKKTWLSGSSDIDIFLHFPLKTSIQDLKKIGLEIGYECIKKFNGKAEEKYASHPYVTGEINGYSIDIVPCYLIDNAEQLRSAVDRTTLHTNYIISYLKPEQIQEVLLLKKFTQSIEVYGSEFKTSGFSGYLCELLILKYGTFENTIKVAAYEWKKNTIIDLEKYDTGIKFDDALIVIDPTDKNRNVASALSLQKLSEFIIGSRNYLNNPSVNYFKPVIRDHGLDLLKSEVLSRGSRCVVISFESPSIPVDAIYPQLKKTLRSVVENLEREGFSVLQSGYWTDEESVVCVLLEFNIWVLPKVKFYEGPSIWDESNHERFCHKHNDIWICGDRLMTNIEREYILADDFLEHLLRVENKSLLKIGKQMMNILSNNKIMLLSDFLDLCSSKSFLEKVDDFLNPGQGIERR